MAKRAHLANLKKGIEVWNQWRQQNPEISVDLSRANLKKAQLKGANLSKAYLSEAHFSGANLSEANFSGAILVDANLFEANLSAADLSEASLSGAYLSEANFSKANLIRATLSSANLEGADLSETNLFAAYFIEANLSRANFQGADLSHANLAKANLSEANLKGAVLIGANLTGVDLVGANLTGADLSEANLSETVLANLDLSQTKGLESCGHYGPSTIDHRTLAKSGRLPLVFLRGCGLPDAFIDYLPSLLHQAIEFYSCFISYSTKDQDFAERLHADLQNKSVRCWFAPHDMKSGAKIHEQIDAAIQVHDRLLLILSEDSMESEWVHTEIAKARKREIREQRRMLFPVRLVNFEILKEWECFDADTGKDSAREIREYFVPDFSNWKDHDSYQKALGRLLADLKAENKSPTS